MVLSGAALFLVFGIVITGYAFALTFSTDAESLATRQPSPPAQVEPPAEDWHVTLANLRELVTTPPTTLTGSPVDVTKPPCESTRVNLVIDKGVAWLKEVVNGRAGGRQGVRGEALAGLTLMECGVSGTDPAVQKVAADIRARALATTATYDIATQIWFLDRLGEARDQALIRTLALRLIANQGPTGGWGYGSRALTTSEEQQLVHLLGDRPLNANWRQEMNASLVPGGMTKTKPPARKPAASGMATLPLFRWEPGKKYDWVAAGHEDNSLTQFAILALWSARKQGVPVERCLAFVEARFRTHQNADGSWGYRLNTTARRDSMTCAGLLGLAVGRGLDRQGDNPRGEVKDEAINKALVYIGQLVGKPAVLRGGVRKGSLIAAQGWGDLYCLWSLERMAVVYDLKTVAGKDWYAWGSDIIMNAQSADGSWHEAFPGVPDTCFALLFLKRVNIVQDLTAQLRLLGKVKDPGHARPAVVLPGETVKPDEP